MDYTACSSPSNAGSSRQQAMGGTCSVLGCSHRLSLSLLLIQDHSRKMKLFFDICENSFKLAKGMEKS